MKLIKPCLALLTILAASSTLHAEQLKGMGEFLDGIKANPARGESAEFKFPAYVKNIEVFSAKDGARLGLVELGNENLHGSIISWGSTKLACVMPVKEAAKLNKGQRIDVKGKVYNISTYQEYNQYAKQNISGLAVGANCDITIGSSPTVAPKEEAAASTKAGRSAEAGVNSALTTASLCDTSEKVVFACNTGKKSVSVCSTPKGLQYRYGIDRNSLDISVDANGSTAGQYPLAGGGVWYMRFSNGSTNYVVYTAESSSIDKAGLVVEQGGKRSATLTCKNAATVNQKLAGEPKDQKGFDVP